MDPQDPERPMKRVARRARSRSSPSAAGSSSGMLMAGGGASASRDRPGAGRRRGQPAGPRHRRRRRRRPSATAAADARPRRRRRRPTPTPVPTPVLVPAPLTGRLVPPAVAARHPIAVMIDDLSPARPQSGFNAASVVWQAPAEGGIPRYMMIFQENIPADVGPVRSSRYYYIAWAAEWRAVYAHAGGSPQALADAPRRRATASSSTTPTSSAGAARSGGSRRASRRTTCTRRQAPPQARDERRGEGRADEAGLEVRAGRSARVHRPRGGRITGRLPVQRRSRYDYDRTTNTYLALGHRRERSRSTRATGERVAPKNVVIMLMQFGPLNDGSQQAPPRGRRHRHGHGLDRDERHDDQGHLAKKALTAPTQFFDANGKPVTLTVGQTFVQVMQTGSKVTITPGKPAAARRIAARATAPPTSGRPRRPVRLAAGVASGATVGVDGRASRGRRPPRSAARRSARSRARLGQRRVDPVVGPDASRAPRPAARVARLDEDPGRADDLGQRPDRRRDDRRAAGDRLDRRQPGASESDGQDRRPGAADERRQPLVVEPRRVRRAPRRRPRGRPPGRAPPDRPAWRRRGAPAAATARPSASPAGRPASAELPGAPGAASRGPGGRRSGRSRRGSARGSPRRSRSARGSGRRACRIARGDRRARAPAPASRRDGTPAAARAGRRGSGRAGRGAAAGPPAAPPRCRR